MLAAALVVQPRIFYAPAPHLSDLVVVPSESDSFWYEFNEASTNTGAITLDELRIVFDQVGSNTEGVIEEDWDEDLVWVIEYADDPQAAQNTWIPLKLFLMIILRTSPMFILEPRKRWSITFCE